MGLTGRGALVVPKTLGRRCGREAYLLSRHSECQKIEVLQIKFHFVWDMSESQSIERLKAERKCLKTELPEEFFAKPLPMKRGMEIAKNELDYKSWICGVPGKKGTMWEGCKLRLYLFFPDKYPAEPPKAQFDPPLFHPNVYPSGSVCLSILNATQGWRPSITIKEILIGIQVLLNEPNPDSPAHGDAYSLFKKKSGEYDAKVRDVVSNNRAEEFDKRVRQLVKSGEFRNTPRPPPTTARVVSYDLDDDTTSGRQKV